MKWCFFEKLNEINKTLLKLTKREKTQSNKLQMKEEILQYKLNSESIKNILLKPLHQEIRKINKTKDFLQ